MIMENFEYTMDLSLMIFRLPSSFNIWSYEMDTGIFYLNYL